MNESEPIAVVIEPGPKREPLGWVKVVIEPDCPQGERRLPSGKYRLVGNTLVLVGSTEANASAD